MFSQEKIRAVLDKVKNIVPLEGLIFDTHLGMLTHEITDRLNIYELHCVPDDVERVKVYLIAENGWGVSLIHHAVFPLEHMGLITNHVRQIIRSFLLSKQIQPRDTWMKLYLAL